AAGDAALDGAQHVRGGGRRPRLGAAELEQALGEVAGPRLQEVRRGAVAGAPVTVAGAALARVERLAVARVALAQRAVWPVRRERRPPRGEQRRAEGEPGSMSGRHGVHSLEALARWKRAESRRTSSSRPTVPPWRRACARAAPSSRNAVTPKPMGVSLEAPIANHAAVSGTKPPPSWSSTQASVTSRCSLHSATRRHPTSSYLLSFPRGSRSSPPWPGCEMRIRHRAQVSRS